MELLNRMLGVINHISKTQIAIASGNYPHLLAAAGTTSHRPHAPVSPEASNLELHFPVVEYFALCTGHRILPVGGIKIDKVETLTLRILIAFYSLSRSRTVGEPRVLCQLPRGSAVGIKLARRITNCWLRRTMIAAN